MQHSHPLSLDVLRAILYPESLDSAAARRALEARYRARTVTAPALSRKLVSFQANRCRRFTRWFPYKEGFSTELVTTLLQQFRPAGGKLLDPFSGIGTSVLAARALGWEAVGIELLPIGVYVTETLLAAQRVPAAALRSHMTEIAKIDLAALASQATAFQHLTITRGAFPAQQERELCGYLHYCEQVEDPAIRELLRFAAFCVLEAISYTRKDGQFLRWDARSGRSHSSAHFFKGELPPFRRAVLDKLSQMVHDLSEETTQLSLFEEQLSSTQLAERVPRIEVVQGSCLDLLPTLPDESFDCIFTSPPYANRYDYTRTYALELAFLSCDDEAVKRLRQRLLSCTVENRSKDDALASLYAFSVDRLDEEFKRVAEVVAGQAALGETLVALEEKARLGRLNNEQVVAMLRNYFFEMAFFIQEAARLLVPGGLLLMVNDNVRYAGEEVPVDCILADLAESFGFAVRSILVLPQGKGNSSQQMGEGGRVELRKCVYVWEKVEPALRPEERERLDREGIMLNTLLCSRWIGGEIRRYAARLQGVMETVERLVQRETWNERERWHIDPAAFSRVSSSPYQVFCHPRVIWQDPTLLWYYRHLSLLSEEEASVLLGDDFLRYERGRSRLSLERAEKIASGINRLLSLVILDRGATFDQREMVNTHPWLSLGPLVHGTWRTTPLKSNALHIIADRLEGELGCAVHSFHRSQDTKLLGAPDGSERPASTQEEHALGHRILLCEEPACLLLLGGDNVPCAIVYVGVGLHWQIVSRLAEEALAVFARVRALANTVTTVLVGSFLDMALSDRVASDGTCSALFTLRALLTSRHEWARFLHLVCGCLTNGQDDGSPTADQQMARSARREEHA